eukprot:g61306.t1
MRKKSSKRTKHFLKKKETGKLKSTHKGQPRKKKRKVVQDAERDEIHNEERETSMPSSKWNKDKEKLESSNSNQNPSIEEMDVDEFLESGFFGDEDEKLQEVSEVEEDDGGEGRLELDPLKAKASDLDEGSGSEEDDVEDLEEAINAHQKELDALAIEDPEFYAMMQKENKDLLSFHVDDEELEQQATQIAKDVKAKQLKEESEGREEEAESSIEQLSVADLKALEKKVIENRSLPALKKLFKVFKTACHLNDDAEAGRKDKFRFADSRTFNRVMRFCIGTVPSIFNAHLGLTAGKEKEVVTSRPKWRDLKTPVQAFLTNLLHFLNQESLEDSLARFILASLETMVPLFGPFPKLGSKLLKSLLKLWGTSENRNTRIDAFLRIRQMALELPAEQELLEAALKGLYLTYVRNSKFFTAQHEPMHSLMRNCLVEIYALEETAAYQHAFVYIRQLAIHLRNALSNKNKTKDTYKSVYNWQFLACVDCWVAVIAAHGSQQPSPLFNLAYPLIQVVLGCLDLQPSSHPELSRPARASSAKAPTLKYLLKVSPAVAQTQPYQAALVDALIELLQEYFTIYSYSPGMPELIIPTVFFLKRFVKSISVYQFRKQVTALLGKLQHNAEWVSQKRLTLSLGPKDLSFGQNEGSSALSAFRVPNGNQKTWSPLDRLVRLGNSAQGQNVSKELKTSKKPSESTGAKNDQKLAGDTSPAEEQEEEEEEEEEEAGEEAEVQEEAEEEEDTNINLEDAVDDFELSSSGEEDDT